MTRFGSLSDPGRVRQSNQDRMLTDPDRGCYLIADGMGGLPGGEVAAQLVIDHLPRLAAHRLDRAEELAGNPALHAVRSAIAELSAAVRHHPAGPRGMGATVVLAWLRGPQALIASLGDSRAYLLHQGLLRRLTTDHCLAELLVQSGELTAEEAATHPARSQLIRYVGMRGHVSPEAGMVPVTPGDRLLLCSDGLTTMLSDPRIEAILRDQLDPEAACRELVDAANAAGGRDNITVITIDVQEELR